MDELAALLGDGLLDRRMRVAERVDADAAQQVEVRSSVLVDEVTRLRRDEENGIPLVSWSRSRSSAARI